MNLSYSLRLICLCLAAFFLVHLAVGLAVSLMAPAIVRWASRLYPRRAATLLFTSRLAPASMAVLVVSLICIPVYLLFEPSATAEEVGPLCAGGALLCLLGGCLAVYRTGRAAVYSTGFMRRCRERANQMRLAGERSALWVVNERSPSLAVLGVFRPEFVISLRLAEALPADELAAALRHEHAHWTARDNFKRLLFLLTPDLVPFVGGFKVLERGWAHFAEWAADDDAVQGDPEASVSLASALVRAARFGQKPIGATLLMSELLPDNCELERRVTRLLHPEPRNSSGELPMATGALLLAAITAVVCVTTGYGALNHVYRALEGLMH